MIAVAAYTFVLLLLFAVDRANSLLAPAPSPRASEIASELSAVRMIRVRAYDDSLNRDLMRWENEGGRIGAKDHKTPGGW